MKNILVQLNDHTHVLDAEKFSELQGLINSLETNLQAAREEGRNLRIAVIGQMKAGKSSLLNSAFFERDLLPKADTPMTAALTKIVYAPQAKAEVIFYTQEDWDGIEKSAAEYHKIYNEIESKIIEESQPQGLFAKIKNITKPTPEQVIQKIPTAVKASLDLVEKAKQQNLDVRQYLGKTEILEDIGTADQLAIALSNYVGSDGRFTAITKMCVLHVDDCRLDGIEIIDTPGFNDPVVSRGQTTRNMLGQCDVIFLLSSAGQFLTSSDMSVLREQLPAAGINEKAIFLIASQRDIALRQDNSISQIARTLTIKIDPEKRAGAHAAAMMQLLDKKIKDLANNTLDKHINQSGQDEKTVRILTALRKASPISISSWAYLTAKTFENLSADDIYQINSLNQVTGYSFEPESLCQLSNIPVIREELLKQRENKIQLLASKEAALSEGVRNSTIEKLKDLIVELDNRAEKISMNNISELEKIERDMVKRIQGGKSKLEDIFDEQRAKISQQLLQLKIDFREASQKYNKVEAIKETEIEEYRVDTSFFKGLFGHDWETRHREIVTIYASAQDAIEQIESLTNKAIKSLHYALIECVDFDLLRNKISVAAMNLFDTSDANFDPEIMLFEVKKSLRRLTIPEISFGNENYSKLISDKFGCDRVSESKIDGLKKAQRDAVDTIINKLMLEIDQKIQSIDKSLEKTSTSFVGNMTSDIQKSLDKLRSDIKNREKSIKSIDEARMTIQDIIKEI